MERLAVTLLVLLSFVLSLGCQKAHAKCSSPPKLKSARLTSKGRSTYNEGQYVTYSCHYGFEAISDVKVYCGQNGKWSKPRFGCNKCYGHWTLIFRAKGRIGGEPSQIFMNSDVASEKDSSVPAGCASRNIKAHCYDHYRSSVIDDWGLLRIKKVKVELLSSKGHVAHVVFNGIATTATSWFSRNKVLSSSWTDLKSTSSNIFSMFGQSFSVRSRQWMMSHRYNGCNGDIGWMVGVEGNGPCPIDKQRNYPAFIYSPYSVRTHYNKFKEADIMAIYIEADGLCDGK